MPRTVYTMLGEPRGILESRVGAHGATTLGRVEAAGYVTASLPTFWQRMTGTAEASLELVPPFDDAGRDVLGLFDGAHEELDGDRDPLGAVRLARGRVQCLRPREPGDEVVVRDAWRRRGPAFRVTTALHFALDVGRGAPIAIAFAQSPLVVAPGLDAPLSRALEALEPAVAARLGDRGGIDWSARAEIAELRDGDEIEALGVTAEPAEEGGRFDLRGHTASYRDAPSAISLVLGDAPGLRMVLRRLG